MKNRISKNIICLRKRKGLSQEKMADTLRITRASLGAWEENRNQPNIETIIRLSKFFKTSIGRLTTYKFK